jgi:hypothetical protein
VSIKAIGAIMTGIAKIKKITFLGIIATISAYLGMDIFRFTYFRYCEP